MARSGLVTAVALCSEKEISEFLRSETGPVEVVGSGSKRSFRRGAGGDGKESIDPIRQSLDRSPKPIHIQCCGVVELSPADQIVRVRANTLIAELQAELNRCGQTIPIPPEGKVPPAAAAYGTVAGSLSMNIPHAGEGLYGSWRDWVLGLTVVMADGTTLKYGSKAVKSVAGYDMHKLFIGARGSLGVLAEVTLRTYPLRSFENSNWDWHSSRGPLEGVTDWIQRTLPSNAADAFEAARTYGCFFDSGSSTIWLKLPHNAELKRFEGDFVLRSHKGEGNIVIEDPTEREYMKRLKGKFDSAYKLNPGEFGFI